MTFASIPVHLCTSFVFESFKKRTLRLATKIAEIPDLVYYIATFLPWPIIRPLVAAHIF